MAALNDVGMVDTKDYTIVTSILREFFTKKGFLEVHPQSRLSILAACEDPTTIATYHYKNDIWPLPQTGQMWLEYEMLKHPDRAPGYFCVSTSYRNEPNPVPGRHEIIFPMFEFEIKGGIEELEKMERELLEFVGFELSKNDAGEQSYPGDHYKNVAVKYGVKELENEHETQLEKDYGAVFFLKSFPNYTSPFWNMAQNEEPQETEALKDTAKKIDVIVHGMETIGSAERSCDKDEMRRQFETISDGGYSQILYDKFTKERVTGELDEFLKFDFFPRSGGGIGLTRLIRGMKMSGLMPEPLQK